MGKLRKHRINTSSSPVGPNCVPLQALVEPRSVRRPKRPSERNKAAGRPAPGGPGGLPEQSPGDVPGGEPTTARGRGDAPISDLCAPKPGQ